MSNLNIDFLISGKQFNSKILGNVEWGMKTNHIINRSIWNVKNSKSDFFYQIKEDISTLNVVKK